MMISDLGGFPDSEYLVFTNTYFPNWLKVRDNIAFCKFDVDRAGNVTADYLCGPEHNRVHVTSFKQFVELMTKVSHTFTVFADCEMDACLALHPDPLFKDAIHKGDAWDLETGCRFYWTKHKLNIRSGNTWWHVLDVSDLSRTDSYNLKPLGSVEEIRDFTLRFLQFCMDNFLTLTNNFTWSGIAKNFLMKFVDRSAWPKWNDPTELDFQLHFLQGNKGPHHGARSIGTFVGADFDRIRSHLAILKGMPSHARWATKYVVTDRYNPDALYAWYWIKCNLPQLPFMPWRIRLDTDFTPEVYGEQSVAVLQPNLSSAIRVLGLKEGKDFEVVKSYQVVSRDGRIRYPYAEACRRVERMLEIKPKDIHLKSMYHRFAGMMFHVIRESDKIIASNVFDPMVASTIWAEEYARCWEALMNSVEPQLMRVDGGTARSPKVDLAVYELGVLGTHLAFNQQFKDKTGETYFRDEVSKQRSKAFLSRRAETRLGFSEAFGNLIPLSEVGKTRLRESKIYPGDYGRKCPEIKCVGDLLDGTVTTEVYSGDEAEAVACERRKLRARLLSL
jgi:hypothetical protein